MPYAPKPKAAPPPLAGALALSLACARLCGSYTGPVEVTRFVGESNRRAWVRAGSRSTSPRTCRKRSARDAFRAAVGNELGQLGYTIVVEDAPGSQVATIIAPAATRSPLAPRQSGQRRSGRRHRDLWQRWRGRRWHQSRRRSSGAQRCLSELSVRISRTRPMMELKACGKGARNPSTSDEFPLRRCEMQRAHARRSLVQGFPRWQWRDGHYRC